jgi:hypothetical protein
VPVDPAVRGGRVELGERQRIPRAVGRPLFERTTMRGEESPDPKGLSPNC